MYIQLTERCNMRCAHCCMNATSKGRDMDWYTFQRAMITAFDFDPYVTIGGGEPTLWPHFKAMCDWLEDYLPSMNNTDASVLMITNGTRFRNTMRAVKLSDSLREYTAESTFQVIMSDPYDGFHDQTKVNMKLYYLFNRRKKFSKYEEGIRTVHNLIYAGRAKKILDMPGTLFDRSYSNCICENLFVKPDGSVKLCGCPDSPVIGNVNYGDVDIPENFEMNTCYKDFEKHYDMEEEQEEEKELIEQEQVA